MVRCGLYQKPSQGSDKRPIISSWQMSYYKLQMSSRPEKDEEGGMWAQRKRKTKTIQLSSVGNPAVTESTLPKLDSKSIFETVGLAKYSVLSWKGLEYVEIKIFNRKRVTDIETILYPQGGGVGEMGGQINKIDN